MSQPQTLPAALRTAAALHGDRTAVVDGPVSLSYRELHEAVRATARGYRSLGLRSGDAVCVWAPNSWEWIVAGLAISYAGGVLVPANTRYKGEEVADIVGRSGARLCIIADNFLGRTQLQELRTAAAANGHGGAALPGLPGVAAVVVTGTTAPEGTTALADLADLGTRVTDLDAVMSAVSPADTADILFTSGTTGRSKGVLSQHRQTLAAARIWAENCRVTPQDRYLVISPFFHTYGYKVGIVASLLSGCAMYPMSTFDADKTLEMIERDRITIVPGAPTIFHSLLESPAIERTDTSSLRLANMGSANIAPRLIERMRAELSFELILPAYGLTECVVVTMCRPGDSAEVIASTNGRAVDGLELRVVDPGTGGVCEAGEAGELQVRGMLVMRGYLDDAVSTAHTLDPDGWLHTGDIATLDPEGNMRITDRLKDMYISGGFNVYPAEIEHALARLEGVVEAAVVGMPDERMGEVGRALIVRRAGSELSEQSVIAFLRDRLANFKVPRRVDFVPSLPRNAAGKVLKTELQEMR